MAHYIRLLGHEIPGMATSTCSIRQVGDKGTLKYLAYEGNQAVVVLGRKRVTTGQ